MPTPARLRHFNPNVNGELLDKMVGHQVGLLRYSSQTSAKLIALLEGARDAVAEELQTRLKRVAALGFDRGPVTTQRVARQLQYFQSSLNQIYETIGADIQLDLEGLAVYETKFQTALLKGSVPINVSYVAPGPETLKTIVTGVPITTRLYDEHISTLAASQFRAIFDRVNLGIVRGETLPQIMKGVMGERRLRYSDGAFNGRKRRAEIETVVRTAVNHTATQAREELYASNSDVIKAVQFVATLDSRTSLVCSIEDGAIHEIGRGPRPPLHLNCRSITVPVVKGFDELIPGLKAETSTVPEVRAMLDGTTSGKVSYTTWLRRQNAEMQDFVLGASRGRLFRANSGMHLRRFADKRGLPLTLDELAKKESQLFEALGPKALEDIERWTGSATIRRVRRRSA